MQVTIMGMRPTLRYVSLPITIFFLSIYCRMRRLSHTLDKAFSKAELSVDIHHPLTDDISGDINSTGISHLFSQLIYDGEYLDFTYFVYAHYLSVFCRMQGLSHTLGNTFGKAELAVDVHHPS